MHHFIRENKVSLAARQTLGKKGEKRYATLLFCELKQKINSTINPAIFYD